MAVKTAFSESGFNIILANYALGSYEHAEPFRLGAIQTNLLLVTTQGKVAFRYYESRSEEYARFEAHVLEYLVEHDYPCPAPIKSVRGDFIGTYRGKPYALFEFLDGEHSESEDNAKQIAQAIGKLHAITEGYRPPYYEARDTYDPTSCWNNAIAGASRIESPAEVEARLEWLRTELDKLELPPNLPKGVCHCDTHPSNFLYKAGELVAVLDFDDSSYTYLLYDTANLLFFWAWPDDGELDFAKARELIREYENHRNVTELEKQHLYDFLKMVNFMGIGWFIDDKAIFDNSARKTDFLNKIGRVEFYNWLFD